MPEARRVLSGILTEANPPVPARVVRQQAFFCLERIVQGYV